MFLHLDAASEEAKAAELRALEVADAMYTIRHRYTGAPRANYNPQLDPKLVSAHNLIDAKTLLEDNKVRLAKVHGDKSSIEPVSAFDSIDSRYPDDVSTKPGDTEPSYAASTKSVDNRAAALRDRITETVPPFQRRQEMRDEEWRRKTKEAREHAKARGNQMTISKRDEEERVLRRMRAKANFIPNPRHAVKGAVECFGDIFVLDPPTIRFIEYEVGVTYEVKLTVRNKSFLSRRVRVVPTASRYFSVSECVWPSDHGVLAPGMACTTNVRFKPESLADYEDFVGIIGETCKGAVPIEAKRHPPRLILDPVIDIGSVLVGGDVEFRVPFKNVGGQGRFRLVDESDWPNSTTALILPNETSDLFPADDFHEDKPVPCISLGGVFRVGPGSFALGPGDFEKFRVGFAPPKPGQFTKTFKMVCDNCQVKTFKVTGRGTVLDVAVVSVDSRDVIAGELAWVDDLLNTKTSLDTQPQPLRFQGCEPGSFTRHTFMVRNNTQVPVPFEWDLPEENETGDKGNTFAIMPRSGILSNESFTTFTATFAPQTVQQVIPGRFRLVVDAAFPPREPLNGAAMFSKPVVVEDFCVSGEGVQHDVQLDVHLVNFSGSLLPGRHYDREVTVVNKGTAACFFNWQGADDAPRGDRGKLQWEDTRYQDTATTSGRNFGVSTSGVSRMGTIGHKSESRNSSSLVLVYPKHGVVQAGETVTCVVEVSAPDALSIDRELRVECKDGPVLPVRVTGVVEGPEVVVAQSAIDFGLLRRNAPGDTYVLIRNPCAVPCGWRVEERGSAGERGGADNNPFVIRFSQTSGVLPPHGETEVECTLRPSFVGQYRSLVHVISAGKTKGAVVHARADILDPKAALSTTKVQLGVTYVGVPVTREVFVQNLTMLPAAFRWSASPEAEDSVSKNAMHVNCSTLRGEIAPGGKQAIRFTFTPMRATSTSGSNTQNQNQNSNQNYSSLLACDVDGALLPLGFELETEIQDLQGNVTYDVLRGSDGVLVASDAADKNVRKVAVLDETDMNTLGPNLGDSLSINFGNANQVREHGLMELVVRNTSAIDTTVDFGFEKFGVSDETARKSMDARRVVNEASAGGRGWGGTDASRGQIGARALGGLPSGDGLIAATMKATSVSDSKASRTLDDTVFGAVATQGPDAFSEAMKGITGKNAKGVGSHPTHKTYHLPNATPGGSTLSFIGAGLEKKPKPEKPKKKITFAQPKLSDTHESVKFSRGTGVRMANAVFSADADQVALSEAGNKGISFMMPTSSLKLSAFGEARVFIGCVTDAPGEYSDVLRCRVGDLPVRRIAVRVGVAGSPLEVRATKYVPKGLPTTGTSNYMTLGNSSTKPVIHGSSPTFGLDWGEVPVGVDNKLTKRFYVTNRGPFDAEVEWTPWLNPIPKDTSKYYAGDEDETVCAAVNLVLDEIAGRVEVNIVGRGVMCARRGPFSVSPSGPVFVPRNGGTVTFEVSYKYKGAKPRTFVGSVVSKQRLLPNGYGDRTGKVGAGVIEKPNIRVDMGSAVANTTLAARSDNTEKDGIQRKHAAVHPVRVTLQGGFHENAAPPPLPMKPLVVRLSATAFAPRVTPDAPVNFNWRCRASAPLSSPEYMKSVTLSNLHTEIIGFRITVPPPFEVMDVEASTPQAGLVGGLASKTNGSDQKVTTGIPPTPPMSLRDKQSAFNQVDSVVGLRNVVWHVPSMQNVHVSLRFQPPVEDVDDFGNAIHENLDLRTQTQNFDGALVLLYENGDTQHFPLNCFLSRPTLSVSNSSLDFRKVHFAASDLVSNIRTITVANDSIAEARWVARSSSEFFQLVPSKGITAAGGCTAIEVFLKPKKEKHYKGVVTFEVEEGRGFEVTCVGEGTLDEAQDV